MIEVNAKGIDNLVLGTVNASWKRSLTAETLAAKVRHADVGGWLPHLATFFTEVRPHLILGFAAAHHIPKHSLVESYYKVRTLTGERNKELESALGELAEIA